MLPWPRTCYHFPLWLALQSTAERMYCMAGRSRDSPQWSCPNLWWVTAYCGYSSAPHPCAWWAKPMGRACSPKGLPTISSEWYDSDWWLLGCFDKWTIKYHTGGCLHDSSTQIDFGSAAFSPCPYLPRSSATQPCCPCTSRPAPWSFRHRVVPTPWLAPALQGSSDSAPLCTTWRPPNPRG